MSLYTVKSLQTKLDLISFLLHCPFSRASDWHWGTSQVSLCMKCQLPLEVSFYRKTFTGSLIGGSHKFTWKSGFSVADRRFRSTCFQEPNHSFCHALVLCVCVCVCVWVCVCVCRGRHPLPQDRRVYSLSGGGDRDRTEEGSVTSRRRGADSDFINLPFCISKRNLTQLQKCTEPLFW